MLSNVRREIELLERHITILGLVLGHEPVGIIKLSSMSGLPQHKVRYSLRVLEHKGLIRPSQRGALASRKARDYLGELHAQGTAIKEDLEALLEKMK